MHVKCGETSIGAVGTILNNQYSIGYSATSEGHDASLPEARLLNRAHQFANPTVDGVQAAMDSFVDALGSRLTGSIVDSATPNAYPVAGYTYFFLRKRLMANCTIAQELLRYEVNPMTSNRGKHHLRFEHLRRQLALLQLRVKPNREHAAAARPLSVHIGSDLNSTF